MKKNTFVLSVVVFSLFFFVASASAAQMNANQGTAKAVAPATGNGQMQEEPVREREEMGEMNGDLIQERVELDGDGMMVKNSSQSAREAMGQTSSKMSEILEMKDNARGVTERVKEVAKEQIQSQTKVEEQLQKMEEKKIWLKKMLGYDQDAVQSVREEMAANRDRIAELEALKEETYDQTELAAIDEAITSLLEQNAALQDTVQAEMQYQGVWGWFRGLFNRS